MKLILYDFDGTIYDGDSSFDFIKFAFKKEPKLFKFIPKYFIAFLKYKFKKISKTQMKEIFFSFLQEIKKPEKILEEFWEKHEHKIKEFYKTKKHNQDIIISASPVFLLNPIAKKYKVYDLIASPVNIKTGKFEGENCLGKEKVRIFQKKYPQAEILEMYTDSKNDLPLINLSQKGFLIIKNNIYDYFEWQKTSILKKFIRRIMILWKSYQEILNYLIFGVLTTIVSLVTYYSLVFTILEPQNAFQLQLANIISWFISVLFAYFTNRKFVFKSKNKHIGKELINFAGSRILTLVLDMLIMFIFVTLLKGNDKLFKLISQVVIIVGNYIISKFWVFKK